MARFHALLTVIAKAVEEKKTSFEVTLGSPCLRVQLYTII